MPGSFFDASESFFIRALVSANRLEKSLGAGSLLFFPGMLFGSMVIPLVIHLANWPAEEPRPKKAAD